MMPSAELVIEVEDKKRVEILAPPIDYLRERVQEIKEGVMQFAAALAENAKVINIPAQVPLAFIKGGELIAFPNLIVPLADMQQGKLSAAYERMLSDQFYLGIVTNLPASKRWGRAENMLNKQEKTTIAKYVRKFDENARDDVVRDVSQKIENFFKPQDMVMAQTPKDYFDMYDFKYFACMQVANFSYIACDPGEAFMVEQRIWPSVWLMHCPQIQGVLLRKNGKTQARGFLWKQDVNGPFTEYGSIFGSTPEFREALTRSVNTIVKKSNDYEYKPWVINTAFEVPAYEMKGKLYAPMIKVDNLTYNFGVYYSPKRNVFTFGPVNKLPKKYKHITDGYACHGFFEAGEVPHDDSVSV